MAPPAPHGMIESGKSHSGEAVSGHDPIQAQENLIQRLIQDFISRTRDGDPVTPDDYAEQYPAIADELLRALHAAVDAYRTSDVTGEFSDVRLSPRRPTM